MAGLIPPHLLEQIRAASDIVDVIGSYVPLKRAGANFRALCPFHREKSPSFNVNTTHQIFKCFGCGKGGDVFTFVKDYENVSFMDAVKRLAERARIPLEFENNPAAQQARHIKEVLWEIHEQICARWQMALLNDAAGQPARDYLIRRGVTEEAVKLFRIGYAPEAWDDTVNWARTKKHDLAAVEQAGLIIKKEGTDRHYDRFRGRLIFPICDEQGRVIAFSGRTLSADPSTPKYVNSPETPIFTKGRVFFGLDKSKRALLEAQSAIVCEGQLDLISCYMAGVKNIVAPQGTALTNDHARTLKRYVEEVILCFDADKAGQNAAIRSLEPLLEAGLAIRVVNVPSGKDPDEFIKEQGGEAFAALVQKAEGFFDYFLKLLCNRNDLSSDKGRLTVIRELGEALAKTKNAVLIDTYSQKTALRLGVAPEAVRAELKKFRPIVRREDDYADDIAGETTAVEEQPIAPPSAHEAQLLRILLIHEEHLPFAASHLDVEWILHPVVRRLAEQRLEMHKKETWQDTRHFFAQFGADPAAQDFLSELLASGQTVPHADKQLHDVILHLRNDYMRGELQRVSHQLAHPDATDEQVSDLLTRQRNLLALRREPLAPRG